MSADRTGEPGAALRLVRALGSALGALGELVLPRSCAGCGRAGTWWCAECEPAAQAPVRVVQASGPLRGLRCATAAAYHGPVGAALVAYKERGAAALLPPLAAALARAVRSAAQSAGPLVLVPVPSRRAVVRSRGADVVADLARAAARELRSEGQDVVVARCLTHARAVTDQTGLGPAERAANLAGALTARRLAGTVLRGRTVVVVDDVLTTGATVAEAARALRVLAPGARVVVATVAAAGTGAGAAAGVAQPRPNGSFDPADRVVRERADG